jgi:hypothetical protein
MMASPHSQYVSGLAWAGTRLLTCSYDGGVRCLDVEAGVQVGRRLTGRDLGLCRLPVAAGAWQPVSRSARLAWLG